MTIIDEINKHLTLDEILKMVPGLKKHGHDYKGGCVTGHASNSRTSFSVNTISPTFNCFNCGVKGSYIHLVELVKFGVSSAGKGNTDTFRETLKYLANKYGLNDNGSYEEKESVFDIIEFAVSDYNSQLLKYGKELMKGISNNYGLTEDFITSESWGYGFECPSLRMREFYTIDELLSTGLFNKSDKTATGVFHIYQNRIVIPYNNLGRVRYTIGRRTTKTKPWKNGGEPPKYLKQYIQRETRPFVSKAVTNSIVYCSKDVEEVTITEGITDYLVLKMHNVNSVSAVTTSFKKDEYAQVASFCKKFKTVYVANDNDANEAGQKGAKRICEILIESGINPNIIVFPRDLGQEKIDLAEYVRDNGIEKFNELKKKALSYPEYLINEIPQDTPKLNLMTELEGVISILTKLPYDIAEIYVLDTIKSRFKLSSMKGMLNSILKKVKTSTPIEEQCTEKKSVDSVFDEHKAEIKMISSGQDYKDGTLYYTVTRPIQTTDKHGVMKIINKPFIVSSDRIIRELKDYQILSDDFVLSRKLNPEFRSESWSFQNKENSVASFINKESKINPADLFTKIKKFITRHVYFKDEKDADFCSVAVMVSMVFMMFNATGYIHLWAEKRSGKTTLMEIFEMLGYNAMMSSSISEAATFRSIEMYRPLLLMDEAEHLNPSPLKRETSNSEKLELLKSGYKKSGTAYRCEGQNNVVVPYGTYSMKIFAGIAPLDTTLADRTITVEMKRAKESINIQELIHDKVSEEASIIRDMLHCFALEFCNDIQDVYLNKLDGYKDHFLENKITSRDKELFTPYLCIAFLVDKFNNDLNLFESIVKKAKKSIDTKDFFGFDTKSMEIVEMLYIWTKDVQEGNIEGMKFLFNGDVYARKGIAEFFINNVLQSEENDGDFKYVNYKKLKQVLRKYDVIDNDCEIKNESINGSRYSGLVLTSDRILEALLTYKRDYDERVIEDVQLYKQRKGLKADVIEEKFDIQDLD